MKITTFSTERMAVGGRILEFTEFEDLAKVFSKCNKGGKLGSGFIRCEALDGNRKDSACDKSELLIIDGDQSPDGSPAPAVCDVIKAMVELGYSFFIYTSHSHKIDVPKYRICIHSECYTKESIDNCNRQILEELYELGIKIQYVKEMKSFSQIWFHPRRDDPEDGLFIYEYFAGKKFKNTKDYQEGDTKGNTEQGSERNLQDMYENIRSGKEFHESMRDISYQLVMDGMSNAHVKAHLKTLMEGSSAAGTQRWQIRYDDIDRMVDGIDNIDNTSSIKGIHDSDGPIEDALPIPPGLAGKLVGEIYENMLYQYDKIALVCAIGSISAICGRKYNIIEPKPAGLNMYMTLVAPTGFGKGAISDYFNCLFHSGLNGKIKAKGSFLGPYKVSGDKALHRSLKDARSRIIVMPEAGIIMQTKSGNQEGLMGMLLEIYGQSHRFGCIGESAYSSADDSLIPLMAPSLSMVCESTIDSIKKAYRGLGAIESGYLPRQSMFKIEKRAIGLNNNIRKEFSDSICDRYSKLMDLCSEFQSCDDPNPIEVQFEEGCRQDMYAFLEYCNTKIDKTNHPIKRAMFTRMGLKAIKFSALCCVWNGSERIGWEEWDWGKEIVEWEMGTIGNSLSYMEGGEDDSKSTQVIMDIMICITKIMHGEYKDSKKKISKKEIKAGIVPVYSIKQACRGVKSIKEMDESLKKGKERFGKVSAEANPSIISALDELDKLGVIQLMKVNTATKSKQKCIQLKEGFDEYCDELMDL